MSAGAGVGARAGAGAAAGAIELDEVDAAAMLSANPSAIPSVASEAARAGLTPTKIAVFAVVALLLVVAVSLLVYRLARKPNAPLNDGPSPAATQPATAGNRFDTEPPATGADGAARPQTTALDRARGGANGTQVPGIQADATNSADAANPADPIGVRATGPRAGEPTKVAGGGQGAYAAAKAPPEDSPILLTRPTGVAGVSGKNGVTGQAGQLAPLPQADPPLTGRESISDSSRRLAEYRQQLGQMMQQLQGVANGASGAAAPGAVAMPQLTATPQLPQLPASQANAVAIAPQLGGAGGTGATGGTGTAGGPGLFGGSLQSQQNAKVFAQPLGNLSLTLPQGTIFPCSLSTRVISAVSGLVRCQVVRNVYSADGRVLLVERGSELNGEYRVTQVRPGVTRIPAVWTRLRTPQGIVVNLDSPAAGALGESGIDGYVDNRWPERIGAALLLSLIDDAVKVVANNASDPNTTSSSGTFVLGNTASTSIKLAEKVLESTINIPPLIYQNQGGLVAAFVARDVDFSSVYELHPVAQ